MSKDRDGKQGWRTLEGPTVSDFGVRWSEWTELWNIH